jgi:hypothetical protein
MTAGVALDVLSHKTQVAYQLCTTTEICYKDIFATGYLQKWSFTMFPGNGSK